MSTDHSYRNQFGEGGHDYRRVIPDALRTVFSLTATPQQLARVQ